jgi:hypothetical protein
MSAVSTLYDGVNTILTTLFTTPTYRQLVNPYTPEENDDKALARGFGFYIGPKSDPNLTMGRYNQANVEIIVVQTIMNRGTDRDLTIRHTAEKNLLEDQFLLIDYFMQNTTTISGTWRIHWESDNGLEPVFADRTNYVKITSTLRAVYSEAC